MSKKKSNWNNDTENNFFAEHLSVILLSFKTNEDIYVMTNPSF